MKRPRLNQSERQLMHRSDELISGALLRLKLAWWQLCRNFIQVFEKRK